MGLQRKMRWDLNPGTAARPWRRGRGPRSFGRLGGENQAALAEWGPHGFDRGENHAALAKWGPHGDDTADGSRSLNHRLLFLRYGTPDWAEGEGRTVCVCECECESKGL